MSTARDLNTELGTTTRAEWELYDSREPEIAFCMSADNHVIDTMSQSEPSLSLSTVVEKPTSILDSPQRSPYIHVPISENQSSQEDFNSFMSWYVHGTIMPPALPSFQNQNESHHDHDDLEDAVPQGMVNSASNKVMPMTSNWQVEPSVSAVPTILPDPMAPFSGFNCRLSPSPPNHSLFMKHKGLDSPAESTVSAIPTTAPNSIPSFSRLNRSLAHPPPNHHLFMHQQGVPSPYSLPVTAHAPNSKKRAFTHNPSQLLPAGNANEPIAAQNLGVPPTKKLKGLRPPLDLGSKRLESDLVRDGIPPAKYDKAEAKLVYDVAMRRKDINFTFSAHFELLKQSLYDQLVAKLNEKLSDGLELENLQLVRDMSGDEKHLNLNDIHHAMIRFTKSGVQRKIDWVFCQEHLDLLYDLDLNKPDLSLVELDKLVKATGVWVLLQGKNKVSGRKYKGKEDSGRT